MRVFISYRRSDSGDVSGRIADRLRGEPGIREVFFDVQTIEPGERFPDRISEALDRCEVVLVVIGPVWIGGRLSEAQDLVRREVATALATDRRMVPVLVGGAAMPRASDLPDDLRALVNINSIAIRHDAFDRDLDGLADAIFRRAQPTSLGRYFRRHPLLARIARSLAGIVIASVLLVLGAAAHQLITGRSLDQTLGSHVWLLIATVILIGATLPQRFSAG